VYYLTVSPEAPVGHGALNVLVYDSLALSTVPWEDGQEQIEVCPITVQAN